MMIILLGFLALVSASSKSDTKDSYKNQYCTDPRTMKKHPAYTEWADAYSCTRHRCQPGGRNLAIYTVGCKRVEAPESAIECEEVVEDTNMQFPFCCTRLRCLVVVRGEVWTRVLGQPWEVLPAAPWSHMYKMKKPPPAESTFLPVTVEHQGPIYELTDNESDKERAGKNGELPVLRTALPSPDIVIALSTNNEGKESSTTEKPAKHSKRRFSPPVQYFEEEMEKEKQADQGNQEMEEVPASTEKPTEDENEKLFDNNYYPVTQKPHHKSYRHDNIHSASPWTEIPIAHWVGPKERENIIEPQTNFSNEETQVQPKREPKIEALMIPAKKETADVMESKPSNLQALVDAIGTRMRDIESVVQKMSDKVHQDKATTEGSSEKRLSGEGDGSRKQFKDFKRPSSEDDNYKRFQSERGTKYLRSSTETTTEKPLFIGDINVKGYFSDPSNSILRRNNPSKTPKESPPTYMAPVVEKRHKPVHIAFTEPPEESEKKIKKHAHKKRRSKGTHAHKKRYRSKEDRRKINKLSIEVEKNAVSLGDSSDT